ncbi:MAG: hypothetical protein FJ010_02745 [Chloroflexi bacterium]|nr:hypothetical protein [Chloroflexota bacterium]
MAYSPTIVEAVAASLGDFPESIGRDATPLGPDIDNTAGTITFGAFSLGATPAGPNGNGVLAILTFRALAASRNTVAASNRVP